MNVRVISFGILKDWLGAAEAMVELPEGATVAELLARLSERRPSAFLRGIAVSVNAEYASQDHILSEGDEVGLLPPVSGGSGRSTNLPAEGGASASRHGFARWS